MVEACAGGSKRFLEPVEVPLYVQSNETPVGGLHVTDARDMDSPWVGQ